MSILAVFTNATLLVPTISWAVAQILKTIINAIVNRKVNFTRLVGDGGMPSGHSATVTALATMVGMQLGFGSIEFAMASIFAIVVMHDATGVRRETGKQAAFIISIAEVLNDYFSESDEQIKTDKLKVLVGHTPLQVTCGALLGVAISVIYFLLFMLNK